MKTSKKKTAATTQMASEIGGVVALIRDFKAKPLMPVFEALVNSIQAIEDRFAGDWSKGCIRIIIHRNTTVPDLPAEGFRREPDIVGFEIVDNGIGFTDVNYDSFKIVASKYKADKGGKGIGRFTWLKAFESATVSSIYIGADGLKYKRDISFSMSDKLDSKRFIFSKHCLADEESPRF